MSNDLMASTPEGIKELKSQKAVCISLRDSLREWGLGIPHHEVTK
jgi:hypothetical protein